MIKILCLFALIAMTAAQYGHGHAHSSQHITKHDGHAEVVSIKDEHGHEKHVDYYTHPKYKFEYKVNDAHTGDHKTQNEHHEDDHVDASDRHVHYHSDKHTGFQAVIKHGTHHIIAKHHHHH